MNQLATPSGLDRDYNYLRGVERNIDHASQDVEGRGIGVKAAASKNVARGWRVDSTLQRYLVQNDITIEHAPKGMSRQKNNQTRPTKSNRIVWTVEWIKVTGERSIQHDYAENSSIASLYETYQAEKRNSERRTRGSKRKRGEAKEVAQSNVTEVQKAGEVIHGRDSPGSTVDLATTQPHNANEAATGEDHATTASLRQDSSSKVEPSADSPSLDLGLKEEPIDYVEPPAHATTAQSAQAQQEDHFYLLKAATTSVSRVVIPLRSQATLTECLRKQVIQEYPTILVLTDSPQCLPKGFLLLEEYLKQREGKAEELRKLLNAGGNGTAPAPDDRQQQAPETEQLDAQSILDMLKRDVRT